MTTEQEALKPCLIAGDCKHGNWCSDVYCQEHCRFVKDLDALDALAELLDEAKGGWDLPPSATARIGTITRKSAAMLRKLVAERDEFRSVMIAAAEEIQAHWDAHCDAEGYGPANLMRRLEEGIPSQYAYTAGDFARLKAEREADREAMREALEAMLHVTDCASRNEHGELVLLGSIYEPEHLDAAITHLRQRLEGTT